MIEKVNESDFSPIAELFELVAAFTEKRAFFNWDKPKALEELKISNSLMYLLDDQIAAFITYRENDEFIEIMALGSNPNFRRRGYVGVLVAEVKKYAARHGSDIHLEVHSKNSAAIEFYKKHGFEVVGKRPNYYSDNESALLMTWKMKIIQIT